MKTIFKLKLMQRSAERLWLGGCDSADIIPRGLSQKNKENNSTTSPSQCPGHPRNPILTRKIIFQVMTASLDGEIPSTFSLAA